MPKAKLQAATLGGSADDIEATFYEALQTADIDKLMGCWADEDDICCVHPGGPRLMGAAAIRASFEAMFANGSILARPSHVRKVITLTSIFHGVLERIEIGTEGGPREAYVVASNVYHKTAQGWRLVVHHASPGTGRELVEANDTSLRLH